MQQLACRVINLSKSSLAFPIQTSVNLANNTTHYISNTYYVVNTYNVTIHFMLPLHVTNTYYIVNITNYVINTFNITNVINIAFTNADFNSSRINELIKNIYVKYKQN